LILYLSIEQIEELHRIQIEIYGGSDGCRNSGGLEAAAARPVMASAAKTCIQMLRGKLLR
jgi:prophage maintenance system killer protein